MQGNRGWLIILTLLLLIVVVLGLLLYQAAENIAESISGFFIFYISLMLALLIPLEILVSELIGRGIYYALSELGNALLASVGWFNREIYDLLYDIGRTVSLAFFIVGSALVLYGAFETALQTMQALTPCEKIFPMLIEAPFNTRLLSKCPFTKPLTKIVSDDVSKVYANSENLLPVLVEYMNLFTETFYLGIAIVFTSGIPRRLWQRLLLHVFTTLIDKSFKHHTKLSIGVVFK